MADEDTSMTNAPLTPGEESELTAPTVEFSPATVPYNEAFENSLMELLLTTSTVVSHQPPSGEIPIIPVSELPIPLSSHMRTHDSPIPGLRLTHVNGYHTGGPGPSFDVMRGFAESFISEHAIEDAGQLERVVEAVTRERLEDAKERMLQRSQAIEKNKNVRKELEDLRLQRSAELRVMERMKGGKRRS